MIRSSGERSTSSSARSNAARRSSVVDSEAPARLREPRKPAKPPSAAVTTSPLSMTSRASSARLRARWPVKPRRRGKRADQRHLAMLRFPRGGATRVIGWPATPAARHRDLSKVGRKRNDAQFLVGGPFIALSASSASARAAKERGEARAGGSALGPAFEREGDLIAFRRRRNPELDVVIGSRRRRWPRQPEIRSLRASSAIEATCGRANDWPIVEPAWR